MAKYFKITEIDASTFECMTGNELDCLQVTMLADDGNVYVAVDEDRQDYIDVDLETFSTTDVAPVVHGRWETNSDRPDTLICSICMCGFDMWKHDPHDYCPNCGSKMDLEVLQ